MAVTLTILSLLALAAAVRRDGGRGLLLFRRAIARLVRRHFDLVAADIHAAPPARPLLADVIEVHDARFTLADAKRGNVSNEFGYGRDDRRPNVRRFLRFEDSLALELRPGLAQN